MGGLPRLSGNRAVLAVSASSIAVPLVGIVTAPVLAHALGVSERGELAASIAPFNLLVGVATLGLPEALTYFAAARGSSMRGLFVVSLLSSIVAGLVAFVAMLAALPFLSGGSPRLGSVIVVATALALPQLALNLVRGLASGRQEWMLVALERIGGSMIRLAAILVAASIGSLTVFSAMLITTVGPLLAGVIYAPAAVREFRRHRAGRTGPAEALEVHRFGLRIWVGTVANLLLARMGQLLFLPLSSARELGLYVVAVTVSDVPLIVALAMRDALYGVAAESQEAEQVARASRITLFTGFIGCLIIGTSLPLWIEFAFGPGFGAATAATWVLLLAGVVNFPGFVAAAGLGAWGRPDLRSAGLVVGVIAIIPPFLLLVPTIGAMGGSIAALISAIVGTFFMVLTASRVLGISSLQFIVVKRGDIVTAVRTATQIIASGVGHRRETTSEM